jgi:hypothetical protein
MVVASFDVEVEIFPIFEKKLHLPWNGVSIAKNIGIAQEENKSIRV